MSEGNVDKLMRILSAASSFSGSTAPFQNYKHMCTLIDTVEVGDVPWQTFMCKYNSNVTNDSPSWMKQGYKVHYRDPLQVVKNILSSTEFNGKIDYTPYIKTNFKSSYQYHNFMLAN